jgi:hypothetical protein
MRAAAFALALAACGGGAEPAPPDGPSNTEDWDRDVLDTGLTFDVSTREATAAITIAGATDSAAASFEIGDLSIESVTDGDGAPLDYTDADGELHVRVPPSADDATIVVDYQFTYHDGQMGADDSPPLTFLWPYYCGNLFPCKNEQTPADGTRFTLALTGVPDNYVAVYPTEIPSDAPDYQIAWSQNLYTELPLGTTTDGTDVSIWYFPNDQARAASGGAHLVAAFDWLEQHLGAYRFGDKVGGVSVTWAGGAYGGMEHHPYWHVARGALGDESVQIHEATHGWFGDGIRLRCWEDFVLSEGTADYLTAHVIGQIEGAAAEDAIWADYDARLGALAPGTAWPDGCGTHDVLTFFNAPYLRGSHFYRAVANRIGADTLDQVLAEFYAAHAGDAAGMQDLLDAIQAESNWDPSACAQVWLRDDAVPAADYACP